MNTTKRDIILLILVAIIVIIPLIMYSSLGDIAYFSGTDDAAGEVIGESGYEPWFSSIWTPPSAEIESLLFVIQGVFGAIIIGYFFGYWRGKSKCKDKK